MVLRKVVSLQLINKYRRYYRRKVTIMNIPILSSVKTIDQQYQTGENPVLVLCSDKNAYICKCMYSSGSAYKLVCELIGTVMAHAWGINTPAPAFVKIHQHHWSKFLSTRYNSATSFGTRSMENVVDITPSTYSGVPVTERLIKELMEIALFDCWIANEDRNINNANLMYDTERSRFVSIDYGCVLNTATFEYPLSQLTSTDTILYSDLFHHLTKMKKSEEFSAIAGNLKQRYWHKIKHAQEEAGNVTSFIPGEWNVNPQLVNNKLMQLFERQWIDAVWDNFIELLQENI